MNEARPLRALAPILAALLVLVAAACSKGEAEAPPLAGASIGGPFTLTNQDGQRVSDTDFDGKYRLVYFGFTFCPDVCPVDMQVVGQGLRLLEQEDPEIAAKVQPIFISVDPARDTPAALKQFVTAFHPRLVGLTGSEAEIAEVAKRYGVYYQKRGADGATDYLMDHMRTLLLFGPKGEPIAIVPHEQGPEGFAAELRKWVR